MKVIVYYREGAGWAIKMLTNVGVTARNTVYHTKEEAVRVAREQYPDKEITIEE